MTPRDRQKDAGPPRRPVGAEETYRRRGRRMRMEVRLLRLADRPVRQLLRARLRRMSLRVIVKRGVRARRANGELEQRAPLTTGTTRFKSFNSPNEPGRAGSATRWGVCRGAANSRIGDRCPHRPSFAYGSAHPLASSSTHRESQLVRPLIAAMSAYTISSSWSTCGPQTAHKSATS